MDEIQRDDITDIPVLPLPVNEGETNYKIALPSRYNDDGTNVVLSYPKEVPYAEAVTEIRNNFKRNSADTQWQMMLPPGDQFHLDAPTTIGDYKQWRAESELYGDGFNTDLGDLLINGAIDFGKAIYYAGKNILGTVSSSDEKEMGRHAFNVLESSMRGVENFSSLVGLGEMFLQKKLHALVDSPEADQADYDAFLYMKGFAKQMADRAAGDMITEGGSSGMFNSMLPGGEQILAAVQKDPNVPAASPQDISEINSASIILDPSLAIPIPGLKLLETVGSKMAANAIAKYFLPRVLATEVAPKMAFSALAKSGKALDYITRGAFNAMTDVVEGVAKGSITDASKATANAMARNLVYGGGFIAAGPTLIKGAIAGKGARAIGEVGLAALRGIEEGSARMAVAELSEDMATSAAVRAVAKMTSKIMPPDAAFNAMKGVADAAVGTGMFMGGIGALRADLAGTDPIKGFEEGFAGGAGFGLVAGGLMAPSFAKEANLQRVARFFENDTVGRPRQRTFTATAADGTQIEIPVNDMQGRVNLFNRTDIPLQEREMILAITRAFEKAGGDVFFLDGDEITQQKLKDVGLDSGKGFQIVDGENGRSIIVLDPNHPDFTAATAAEEVFHGVTTDATVKEVVAGIKADLGTQDTVQALGVITDFGSKYIAHLEASPGGKPHADKLREIMAAGTAPGLSDQQRISMLTPIISEYAANYVGAALAGMKPSKINQPQINNIWDKVWDKATSNILSTFDRSRLGVSKDPITGHFFDSGGQRIKSPAMEHIVERFIDAAREGKASIDPQNTVDGTTYFDVRPLTGLQSVEDVLNGKQTTKRQKEKILAGWFADTATAARSFDGDSVYVVTPELRDSGFIHGNLPKDDSTVFFQRVMSPGLVDHLSRQVVNGRRVFEDPQIPRQWNDAVANKRIITLDSWHNISKTTGDRTDSYYARANRWALPLGTQQMPKGGMTGAYLDISRMWSNITELMKASPKTKKSFSEKGINNIEDFLPVAQRYFDNLASDTPVPTADLPGFTPEIRNAISKSLDLKQVRAGTGDEARFKNDNTFSADFFRNLPRATVDIGGKRGTMGRESVALGSIRLDRINGISEFTINGSPVTIRYNDEVPNLVRANFSPGGTKVEQLGESVVMTDEATGKRIITGPTGKSKLFDGDKVSIHDTPQAAINQANKNSVKEARFSPAGGGEFKPKVGDEVEVFLGGQRRTARILKAHKSTLGHNYYAVDIPGSPLISELSISPLTDRPAAVPTEQMSAEQHIAKLQKLAGNGRSTTASLVDAIEKMYADGAVSIDAKNDFIARINGPGTQSMKQRKPARQEALNRLYIQIGTPELVKSVDDFKLAQYQELLKQAEPFTQYGQQYSREVHAASKRLADVLKNTLEKPKDVRDASVRMESLDVWADQLKTKLNAAMESRAAVEPESVVEPAPAQPESQPESPRTQPESVPQDQFEALYGVLSPKELAAYRATFAKLKEQPMPGAEELVSRKFKEIQDKRLMSVAKTPSSLAGGRMDEMYGLIQKTFAKKSPIVEPPTRTPSSLQSMAKFKEEIQRAFSPEVLDKLVRGNPLVRREDVPISVDTRTPAQIKRNNEQALALAKRENVIRYREQQRMEKLESRLDALQARQRKSASAERAKEMKRLLDERDRLNEETDRMIALEREASKARQMEGEAMEEAARRSRTSQRAYDMARLLNERDAAMIPRRITMPNRILPPEPPRRITLPEGLVDSSLVPQGIDVFKTKSGKFRVILSSGEAIGITDEYKDAVKLAQKYATKKVRIREGVR